MIGECTGNVRSTPTPKLTLRTVKVSCRPPPWRRITTPWNTWTRSRLPSTTRTWTFSVSPGEKAGTSSRRLARSTRSVGFMARGLLQLPLGGRCMVRQSRRFQQRDLLFGEAAPGLDEVRAVLQGTGDRHRPAPVGHPAVVAAAEHLRH